MANVDASDLWGQLGMTFVEMVESIVPATRTATQLTPMFSELLGGGAGDTTTGHWS